MNTLKTVLLMTVMMMLFMLVGGLIGGESGVMMAFAISLVMNFGSYWFSDKIVLSMYKAQEITESENPQLYNSVRKLSEKALIPIPRVYIINSASPNAFATGRNPENAAVAVSTGLLNILNQDELDGVIAHELGHIKNRDILTGTIVATLVGTITFIARMAGWAMMFGGRDEEEGGGISDLLLMILAPIAAVLIQMAISRSREFAADNFGAQISGKPLGLASALNKLEQGNHYIPKRNAEPATAHLFIVNPLTARSFGKLFSTHPPTEERIARLQEIASGRRM